MWRNTFLHSGTAPQPAGFALTIALTIGARHKCRTGLPIRYSDGRNRSIAS
jgi:hypothetical protein